jgi:hypothetical protein
MPARKPPPPDEKPQRERFIETAREIGASEDPQEFERAFAKVVQAPLTRQDNPMSRDGEPFAFTLEPAEIAQITDTSVKGRGGLQTLQNKLRAQLEAGRVVQLDNAGLGQLIRYMTRHGGGGFEDRLRRAFARSFLDLFTPIFEAERRS